MTLAGLLLFAQAQKKLIEFGWDEPDPAFMREHAEDLERTPFDGCVFHVSPLTWGGWGTEAHSGADLQKDVENLKAAPLRRFTHNFVRFNTTPAKLDWFDDHGPVISNARLAAHVAREGRSCKGVLFDIEQYEGQLFNYKKQRDSKSKSWDEYAAQVRKRGQEVMQAFQQGYPGLVVFLTFGYSLPWAQSNGGKRALADCSYGLLAPFMDGLVEGAQGETKVVDGHELSYGYRDPTKFGEALRTMREEVLTMAQTNPKKYAAFLSAGFGLWMDNDWRKQGWNLEDFTKNHFTPEQFEASLKAALAAADEYVWIYTETPRWWSKEGKPVKLPEAYEAAIRRARRR